MSKKWNIFRKKGSKADSHGTTAADEELQFQLVRPDANEKVTRLSTVQGQALDLGDTNPHKAQDPHPSTQKQASFRDRSGRGDRKFEPKRDNNSDRVGERLIHLQVKEEKKERDEERGSEDDGSAERLNRPSTVPKTLTKPGMLNAAQRKYVPQGKDVSISDEYSDPFDAQRKVLKNRKDADGYIEPYKAQQIFQDAARGNIDNGWNSGPSDGEHASGKDTDYSGSDNYQDPWDKSNAGLIVDNDRNSDQGKDETLPFSVSRRNGETNFKKSNLSYQRGRGVGGLPHNDSWSSGEFPVSSESPNIGRHRLVRVENPRVSPRSSPHFDRRLILPKDTNFPDNYSEPWSKQVKFRPVDKRLIKAEPSLEEMRRMSPSGANSSIGTGSPISSGRGSPDVSTMADHAEAARRSSSPVVSSRVGMPTHLINMNKCKSRSLDMRNHPQALATLIGPPQPPTAHQHLPKSVSDEQLGTKSGRYSGSPSRTPLRGVGEYEEPWDNSGKSQTLAMQHNKSVVVSHIRSRSYELQKHPLHTDQHYYDRREMSQAQDCSFYEQPWDKVNPGNHLQSMQRFQQRKLELHPSEAINTRDFDPLQSLEKQTWYHRDITRDDAEIRLMNKCEGSYLVRKSESTKDSYSLSVQTGHGCIHMLLRCTRDESWILGEFSAPFLSAPEMVAHYTRNRLKINDSEYVTLSSPVADPYL